MVIFQGLPDKHIRQTHRSWEPRENGSVGLHEARTHSRTEQVLLWDDTDQSSKQMLVCPVLRENACWKWGFETGSKAAMLFLAGSPDSSLVLVEFHWEKDRPQENLCECLQN